MGLDQYVYAFKGETPQTQTDFGKIDGSEQIFYWRKHANLQGWMSNLYYDKGGKELFNYTPVLLTKGDIENLKTSQLPHTTGCFFGQTTPDKLKQDKEFIRIALKKLSQGYQLYYLSSW